MVTCHDRKFRDSNVRNSLLGESLSFVLYQETVASKCLCGMNGHLSGGSEEAKELWVFIFPIE